MLRTPLIVASGLAFAYYCKPDILKTFWNNHVVAYIDSKKLNYLSLEVPLKFFSAVSLLSFSYNGMLFLNANRSNNAEKKQEYGVKASISLLINFLSLIFLYSLKDPTQVVGIQILK